MFFRRRRVVNDQVVTSLRHGLQALAANLGVRYDARAVFASAVFEMMIGKTPERLTSEAVRSDEATKMERRMTCAANAIRVLLDERE